MSWSVAAVGKSEAVRAEIKRQFEAASKCAEPEETVRQAAAVLIDAAVAAQDPNKVVKVVATGSQYYQDWNTKEGVQNTLSIAIDPLANFVS